MGKRLPPEHEALMAAIAAEQDREARRLQEQYDLAMKPAPPFVPPSGPGPNPLASNAIPTPPELKTPEN
jgi:hypothetical protein